VHRIEEVDPNWHGSPDISRTNFLKPQKCKSWLLISFS
jgi:hypothetical protein